MTEGEGDSEIGIFCTKCFASDQNSSWGEPADHGHCFNCGAGGTTVQLPRWGIKLIRESASWVGKRYYPCDEDRRQRAELDHLRSMAPTPPGRFAERSQSEGAQPDQWRVTQRDGDGSTMVLVTANSEADALRIAAPMLPYPIDKAQSPWVPTPPL